MTVEHWERFCVLRVSRLLMAVINFKTALLLFLLHNLLHVWWYNFPNTSRAVKVLIAALRAPGAPCDGPQALADGDGHHVADVLHHEHMSRFTSHQMSLRIYLWRMSQKQSESQLRVFNWCFAWFLDFTRIIKAVSVDQWEGLPSWQQSFAPLAEFWQNWTKVELNLNFWYSRFIYFVKWVQASEPKKLKWRRN